MTNNEFLSIEHNYNDTLDRLRYLTVLYYSLLDVYKNNYTSKNKLNKRIPFKMEYSRQCHSEGEIVNYKSLRLHLESVDTFEIIVSNILGSDKNKDIIKAFPKGAGWAEDNWYTRKDLPKLLGVVKRLKKETDRQFSLVQAEYEKALKIAYGKEGLKSDPISDLKMILSNANYRYNIDNIKELLKSKGIEV